MAVKAEFEHYDDIQTFDRIYQQKIAECETHRQAYQQTERIYLHSFGKRRYSNFTSFKNAYSQRHRKK